MVCGVQLYVVGSGCLLAGIRARSFRNIYHLCYILQFFAGFVKNFWQGTERVYPFSVYKGKAMFGMDKALSVKENVPMTDRKKDPGRIVLDFLRRMMYNK